MGKTNKELIEKADFDLAALASGGLQSTEVADKFITEIVDDSDLLSQIDVYRLNGPERAIDKIGFGGRISRAAVEGTALEASDYAVPTTTRILLKPKEFIAVVPLTYDAIENNIERGNINISGPNSVAQPVMGGIKDTVMSMAGRQISVDMQELLLLGDTASADTFLAKVDGVLKIAAASGHQVDHLNAVIDKSLFKAGRKAMPSKYLRDLRALRQLISYNQDIDYRDSLANRDTGAGDRYTEDFSGAYAMGIPVQPVSLMPEARGIFTHPKNLIMGIQRDISVEVDKRPLERRFLIVITYKVDFQVQEPDALVNYKNIG